MTIRDELVKLLVDKFKHIEPFTRGEITDALLDKYEVIRKDKVRELGGQAWINMGACVNMGCGKLGCYCKNEMDYNCEKANKDCKKGRLLFIEEDKK